MSKCWSLFKSGLFHLIFLVVYILIPFFTSIAHWTCYYGCKQDRPFYIALVILSNFIYFVLVMSSAYFKEAPYKLVNPRCHGILTVAIGGISSITAAFEELKYKSVGSGIGKASVTTLSSIYVIAIWMDYYDRIYLNAPRTPSTSE